MPEPVVPTLRLEPFHGVRYREGTDLAAVTAPPYDVLDRDAVAALSAAEPHNLVRLLLPEGPDPASRSAAARATLDGWLADGTLRADGTSAVYVYEAAADGAVALRGLVGALRLPPEGSDVVLPHEDVMPPVVDDRAALQAGLRAQVEPIWLVYEGGGTASSVVDAVALTPPLEECTTSDGVRHRLWAVTDPEQLAAIEEDLADRQAMIADGHHRFAAYRQVQAAARAGGRADGPEDLGLALLVDSVAHAPQVAAIHRVVRGVGLDEVGPTVPAGPWTEALDGLRTGRLLVVDGSGQAHWLELPTGGARTQRFAATSGAAMPAEWQDLDAAYLHEVLLPEWWVAEEQVTYHHAVAPAVTEASRVGGLALLLAPIGIEVVLDLAGRGIRMPRKSTSFGPKPRGGFVLRSFDR